MKGLPDDDVPRLAHKYKLFATPTIYLCLQNNMELHLQKTPFCCPNKIGSFDRVGGVKSNMQIECKWYLLNFHFNIHVIFSFYSGMTILPISVYYYIVHGIVGGFVLSWFHPCRSEKVYSIPRPSEGIQKKHQSDLGIFVAVLRGWWLGQHGAWIGALQLLVKPCLYCKFQFPYWQDPHGSFHISVPGGCTMMMWMY